MAILELRSARGWTAAQTARAFFLEPATISSWIKRIDEPDDQTLIQLPEPVNKFPAFVGYIVRRLRTLCPTLGKKRIAQILARVGLHLGVTTVARMLKAKSTGDTPVPLSESGSAGIGVGGNENNPMPRVVTVKYPNHVWHVDLTVVPTAAGFWIPWLPFAKLQVWPFCWWVAPGRRHSRISETTDFTEYQKILGQDHRQNQTCAQIRHFRQGLPILV